MDTVVKAQPKDLLAMVWYRLGYRPRDSLVIVGLHGPRNRSGVVMRVDLPRPGVLDDFAHQMASVVKRSGAGGAFLLVMADDVLTGRPPAVAEVVPAVFTTRDIDVLDVIGVGRDAYRSLRCHDANCCPPGGKPLEDVMSSEVAAHHVLHGEVVAESEAALVADVQPVAGPTSDGQRPDAGAEGLEAGDGDCRGGPRSSTSAGSSMTTARRLAWWHRWEAALAAGRVEPAQAVGLASAMRDKALRDAILVSAIAGPWPGMADVLADSDIDSAIAREYGAGGALELDRVMSSTPDAEIDERIERARVVLSEGARSAQRRSRADALSVLAWLAWYQGKGARARLLAQRALEDRPGHLLSTLVDRALKGCVPPPWVTGRSVHRSPRNRGS